LDDSVSDVPSSPYYELEIGCELSDIRQSEPDVDKTRMWNLSDVSRDSAGMLLIHRGQAVEEADLRSPEIVNRVVFYGWVINWLVLYVSFGVRGRVVRLKDDECS